MSTNENEKFIYLNQDVETALSDGTLTVTSKQSGSTPGICFKPNPKILADIFL